MRESGESGESTLIFSGKTVNKRGMSEGETREQAEKLFVNREGR
jgi:hypothetical protein